MPADLPTMVQLLTAQAVSSDPESAGRLRICVERVGELREEWRRSH
jgi:hypothetical protein